MNDLEVMGLFPKPVGVTKLPSFDREPLVALADTLEYRVSMRGRYDGCISMDNQILNGSNFVNIKKEILAYARIFGRTVLGHISDDLHISCSWMTKIDKGESTAMHSHTNCYFCGVLYLTEGAPALFTDFNLSYYMQPDRSELNEYNRDTWPIEPTPGKLILFPSALAHGVHTSTDSHSRYSLAFNIVPVGEIGTPTSFLQLPFPR